jgi:hypothetical protein
MSPFRRVMLSGPRHSARNAQLIREWALTEDGIAAKKDFRAYLEDWRKRGFLTAEDAKRLMTEGA